MTSYTIVGAKFRPPAQGILNVLASGSKLIARREPSNAYDANAIQIIWYAYRDDLPEDNEIVNAALAGYGSDLAALMENSDGWHLGYIPRTAAITLAPKMDAAGVTELEGQFAFSAIGIPRCALEEPTA